MTDPSYVIVLPAIDRGLSDDCLASMAPSLLERVFLVDNTGDRRIARTWAGRVMFAAAPAKNIGVTKAWDQGMALANAMHTDYLIIMSTSLLFGAPGGLDFLKELDARRPEHMMHGKPGWHCLAVARKVWETVGKFDTTFFSYRSDTDYLYRMGLAGLPSPRENGGELDQIDFDARSQGQALAVQRKLVKVDWDENLQLYVRKWNGDQGHETFTTPYGDPTLDYTHVGPPPVRTKETA